MTPVHLDHKDFAALLLDFEPETVVHLQTVDRASEIGRTRAHEGAVVGAQSLFGAVGQSDAVRHGGVKSQTEVMEHDRPGLYQIDLIVW